MAVLVFFVAHYFLSLFAQTFFLHRYSAHKMFTMSKGWEKFFHLFTFVAQGSSYLDPRGYAILHRMHHAYSDTPGDPHSPTNHQGPWALFTMMWQTKTTYDAIAYGGPAPESRFDGDTPSWPILEDLSRRWSVRLTWGALYFTFYVVFATEWWQFLLVPVHWLMGPIHGSIVNWCGHRYGYRNYDSSDVSRNMLPFDFLAMGELFQNNHHRHASRPNFANRWFEVDPCYQVMRVLSALGIIRYVGKSPAAQRSKTKDTAAIARATTSGAQG